jgi:hypothetical protein
MYKDKSLSENYKIGRSGAECNRHLELFAPDEVSSERGRDLRHHGRRVLLHRVIAWLRQVAHEPQDRDPEGQCSLGVNVMIFKNIFGEKFGVFKSKHCLFNSLGYQLTPAG